MAQIRTWDFGEKRQGSILNRNLADVLPAGIYNGFFVRATVAPSLFFDIKTTDGVTTDPTNVILTAEGVKIEEDADLPGAGSVAAGDPTDPRIDSVFVKHQFSAANDPAVIEVLTGTPAPSPVPPTLPVDGFFRVKLADITVPALASDITNPDIGQAGKVPIGPGAILSSLSDVSVVQSDAFAAMRKPSTPNAIATLSEVGTELLRPTESSTPDDDVNLAGGELWDKRQGTVTTVAPFTVNITPAPAANPRIDLITVDPDTGTPTLTTGAENPSPVRPAIPSNDVIPVCYVSVTEVGGPVVVDDIDITDARPIIHTKTPELFDLPNMTTDIKDAITSATAPTGANEFVTQSVLDAAVDPLTQSFAFSRVQLDTGITVNDQTVLADGAIATCADSGFTVIRTVRLTSGDLSASGSAGVGPGGLEFTGTFTATTWFYLYLIAKSTGSAPGFDADLVISLSAAAPNLGGGSFPGYDIFRRIAALRTDASPIWLQSFTKNNSTYYVDGQSFTAAVSSLSTSFATGPNPIAFSTRIPPTSRRGEFIVGDFLSPSAGTLFATHGTDARTTTGGRTISQDVGTGGSQINSFFLDLDSSQQSRMRVSAGTGIASPQFELHGYVETP